MLYSLSLLILIIFLTLMVGLYITEVLILGSSIVRRLERDLVQWGRTLRLPLPVRFAGQSGLQFSGLRTLLECAIEGPPPAYLVQHVGANDIGRINTIEWAQELQLWLTYIGARYPTTRVVWSDMLPRRAWRYSVDPAGAESAARAGPGTWWQGNGGGLLNTPTLLLTTRVWLLMVYTSAAGAPVCW